MRLKRNNFDDAKLGGWEDSAIIILVRRIRSLLMLKRKEKKEKRKEKRRKGIIWICWSYVKITSKHLQCICKAHRKNTEKMLSVENKPIIERNRSCKKRGNVQKVVEWNLWESQWFRRYEQRRKWSRIKKSRENHVIESKEKFMYMGEPLRPNIPKG